MGVTNASSYTTGTLSVGTYYYYCKASSSSGEVTSDVFTVNVINPGSGSFTGKLCFDLAQGNDDENSCGQVSARLNRQTVFSDRTPQDGTAGSYSGVQVYTFTPDGTVSHVRFGYAETADISVGHIEPASTYATDDNINYACKLTVYFREELDAELRGTDRDGGNKLKLYVIYSSDPVYSGAASDRMQELSLSLQDCSCCGAYLDAAKTQWLNFMCHNLGADESYNPFTPSRYIHGAKYLFGDKEPVLTQEEDLATGNNLIYPWYTSTATGDWLPENNPCPAGWRLPTQAEWNAVVSNNSRSYKGNGTSSSYDNGWMVGSALFLPAAGYRGVGNGGLGSLTGGNYWTRYARNQTEAYYMAFHGSGFFTDNTVYINKSFGISVRCVAE